MNRGLPQTVDELIADIQEQLRTLRNREGGALITDHQQLTGREEEGAHPQYERGASEAVVQSITWTQPGPVLAGTGGPPWSPGTDIEVLRVRIRVGATTPPVGASLIVDVNRNGSTIFVDQSHRPEIADGELTDLSTDIDDSLAASTDYFTVDHDQVGSTSPGSDLTVTMYYREV